MALEELRTSAPPQPSLVLREARSSGPMTPSAEGQPSPSRKSPVTAVGMRPSRSSHSRDVEEANNAVPPQVATDNNSKDRPRPASSRTAQLADLQHALSARVDVVDAASVQSLRQQVDKQQQVIDEMRQAADSSRVVDLKRELDHAHSLVADLQTALRSQETTFAEMLRAQEAVRASQAIQSSLEAQVAALTSERDALRSEARVAREEADQLRAAKEGQERQHERELTRVREAFVQYDANVAEYLEEVRLEHAAELDRACREERERVSHTPARSLQATHEGFDASHSSRGGAGVEPDQLRSALMRHLNSYANARMNLPVGDPLPSMATSPAAGGRHDSSRAPTSGRDRGVL